MVQHPRHKHRLWCSIQDINTVYSATSKTQTPFMVQHPRHEHRLWCDIQDKHRLLFNILEHNPATSSHKRQIFSSVRYAQGHMD